MANHLRLTHPDDTHRTLRSGLYWAGFALPQLWSVAHGLGRPWALSYLPYLVLRVGEGVVEHCQQPPLPTGNRCPDAASGLWLSVLVMQLPLMLVFGLRGNTWRVRQLQRGGYTCKPEVGDHGEAQA